MIWFVLIKRPCRLNVSHLRLHHIVKDIKSRDVLLQQNEHLQNTNRTHSYKLDFELTPEEFVNEINAIQDLKKQWNLKSETEEDWKVSRELVADTFDGYVLQNEKDQAVYFYSKNCHGCKRFGKFYELLALEELADNGKHDIQYNRMNNSLNHVGAAHSRFLYTPVFAFYKSNLKAKGPLVYKQSTMSLEQLKSFFEVTKSWEAIPEWAEAALRQRSHTARVREVHRRVAEETRGSAK